MKSGGRAPYWESLTQKMFAGCESLTSTAADGHGAVDELLLQVEESKYVWVSFQLEAGD